MADSMASPTAQEGMPAADPFASAPFAKPLAPHRAKKPEGPAYGLLLPKAEEKSALIEELEKEVEAEKTASTNEVVDELPVKSHSDIPLMYKPPFWSGRPKYTLELVQNGVSKGKKPLWKRGWYLVGRAPICDIILDHPTVSRQHAVIQYKKNGEAYLFDLGSTHGTFIGKERVKPNSYIPIVEGNNLIKFGTSSRFYILETNEHKADVDVDSDDEDLNSDFSKKSRSQGGEGDLRKLFSSLPEEESPKVKKKKAKKRTATDDLADELDEEDDDMAFLEEHKEFFEEYYEGDDNDEFFDRTGKNIQKKQKEDDTRSKNQLETYDTLSAKERVIKEQKDELEKEVQTLQKEKETIESSGGSEEIDSYMKELTLSLVVDKLKKKSKLLVDLTSEHAKIAKLASIAKPALAALSDNSNITPDQIARVTQFEVEIKRRKRETDAKVGETEEDKARKMKQQMTEHGKARREKAKLSGTIKPTSSVSTSQAKRIQIEDYKPSFIPGQTPINSDNTPETPAPMEEKPEITHTVSLLSGLEKDIQEQRKSNESKSRKRKIEGDDDLEQSSESEGPQGDAMDVENSHDDDTEGHDTVPRPIDSQVHHVKKPKGKKHKKARFDEEVDGAYETWEPPVGQTGDGRSYLNEKFGY